MIRPLQRFAATAALILTPTMAMAHTGVGATTGFAHGFLHPLSGLDHLLAMVLVGMFAWQLGGRALWAVPASFVGVMALGGVLGVAGLQLPLVEIGIALSVVVLGTMVAFRIQPPVALAMGVVAFFAVFHGHAHGSEMPETASGLTYAAGFILATALLHVSGIALGLGLGRVGGRLAPTVVRSAGGVAAVAGLAILTGVL
ncbi:MAG: HupE/UreJ family protein [Geminicoccaceae bacterium]